MAQLLALANSATQRSGSFVLGRRSLHRRPSAMAGSAVGLKPPGRPASTGRRGPYPVHMAPRSQFRRKKDGKPLPHAEIEGKLATEYLAYASLKHDLTLALELIDKLAAEPAPGVREEDWIRLGLWMAIVNAYGRCFSCGRRHRFSGLVRPRARRQARLHEWMLEHRNTYIAHLDPRTLDERGAVVAMLAPLYEAQSLEAVTHFHRLPRMGQTVIPSGRAACGSEQFPHRLST